MICNDTGMSLTKPAGRHIAGQPIRFTKPVSVV
jgi:hypothetical protein